MSDLIRVAPNDFTSSGDDVEQGFKNDNVDFQNVYEHLTKLRNGYRGVTPPQSPNVGDKWTDISSGEEIEKKWSGTAWESLGKYLRDDYSQNVKIYNLIVKGIEVNAQAFDVVGDGITDDTAKLRLFAEWVMTNKPEKIIIPAKTYILNLNVDEILFDLSGFQTVTILAEGAIFKRTTSFTTGQTATIFKFINCKNIYSFGCHSDGPVVDLSLDASGTDRGYLTYHFADGNDNINLFGQKAQNNYSLALFGSGPFTDPKAVNTNIRIDAEIIRCEYGVNFANSGDYASIKIKSEFCHRP